MTFLPPAQPCRRLARRCLLVTVTPPKRARPFKYPLPEESQTAKDIWSLLMNARTWNMPDLTPP